MGDIDRRQAEGPASLGELISWSVVAILATLVAVVWWARDRGLDISDEGYYLQLYAHPETVPPNTAVSQFYRLVDLLTGSADLGIVGYRVLALVLLVTAGGFFGYAVARFSSDRLGDIAMPPLPVTVSFVTIGGLLGYAWAPLAVSYNTLAAALIYLATGMTLLALTDGSRVGRRTAVYATLAGVSLPFLFYVKWPASVLLAVVLAVFALVVWGRAGAKLLAIVAASGIVMFAIVTEELLGGPFSLAAVFDRADTLSTSTHQPTELIKKYVLWLGRDIPSVLWQNPLRLVALLMVLVGEPLAVSARAKWGGIKPWVLPAIGGVYLVAEIPGASYLDRLTNFRLLGALIVVLGLSVLIAQTIRTGQLPDFSIRKLSRPGRLAWLLVLLGFGLALITAFGSNSHILTVSFHGGAGVGAAIVVVVATLAGNARDGAPPRFSVALPVLAVLFAAQIVNGVVADPYRLVTSRVEQTAPVPGVPRLEGIRFDEASAVFLSEVNRVVYEETSFVPGDKVLAIASMPGLVYVIDGTFPGSLWIRRPESGRQGEICSLLRSFPDELAGTNLLLQNSPPSAELAACLGQLLHGYPDLFLEVGGVDIPDGYGAGNSVGQTLQIFEYRP